jgi:hypothetical protein
VATVPIKPGKTEIQLTARGRLNRIPPQLLEVPGGLYPLHSAAYEVDEYRIMAGWPVPVPTGDIRIDCLVSAEGDVLGNRDAPTSLTTNADMRWVADADFYDQIAMLWRPLQSDVSPWVTSVDHAPALITNYEYRVGQERFVSMTALNFDSDNADYMWNDLSLSMGGTSGYTLIMVVCPNSIYGNAVVFDNAFWGPDNTSGAYAMFSVREKSVFMTTELMPPQKGVPIGGALVNTAPTYLALVVARPQTVMYAASGPSNVQTKSLVAGPAPVSLSTRFRLGWGPSPASATMDMALMDLGIYGDVLTRQQVLAEITLLSQVYGGDT